jgi:hypothetical protein
MVASSLLPATGRRAQRKTKRFTTTGEYARACTRHFVVLFTMRMMFFAKDAAE